MSSRSYVRGHEVYYDFKNRVYRYYDDNTEVFTDTYIKRPCPRCNIPPTEESHDACLGSMSGVEFACCGHGVRNNCYVTFKDGRELNMNRAAKQAKLVENWNLAHEVVIPVAVKKDDGTSFNTTTRTHADLLGTHTAVIWVEGISACYLLERVTALDGK